jgi:predicted acetyltransferase
MNVRIENVRPDEVRSFLGAIEGAFSAQLDEAELASELAVFEADRALAAVDDGRIVGGVAAYSLNVSVPGGELPMAGVTAVGVLPTHRRRGILTTLIRQQLDGVRERGEVLAGLWSSEGSIYGRFGYAPAVPAAELSIARARSRFARGPAGSGDIRLVDKEQALAAMPGPYDALRRSQPGMMARSATWWEHAFADPEGWRGGGGALLYAVHEDGGTTDGYAAYRVVHNWEPGDSRNVLRIHELAASNDAAHAELWRYCLDIDLIETIEATLRPVDEPLVHLLADPRALKVHVRDTLWLRPVDVAGALSGRRYVAEGSLVLEVADEFCPWNTGSYVLEGGPDGASCTRGGASPDLSLSAADLGAAFLGGTRLSTLAHAGRVIEHAPGALARADAMFGWHRAPWCPNHF